MFLLNSRYPLFCYAGVKSIRHSFSRSYGVILPSSFNMVSSTPWYTLLVHLRRFRVRSKEMKLFLGEKFLSKNNPFGMGFIPFLLEKIPVTFQLARRFFQIAKFPSFMAFALKLGAGFLCGDWPCAETLELEVPTVFTSVCATYASILASDFSNPACARSSRLQSVPLPRWLHLPLWWLGQCSCLRYIAWAPRIFGAIRLKSYWF